MWEPVGVEDKKGDMWCSFVIGGCSSQILLEPISPLIIPSVDWLKKKYIF